MQIDCVGPWTVNFKYTSGKIVEKKIDALTAVDQAITFPEIWPISEKTAEYVAKKFDAGWLCRYPRPKEFIHDKGGELMGVEFQQMLHSYGIKSVPTTVKNPQENSLVEKMHLRMGNILRMTSFKGENWWEELEYTMQCVAWSFRTKSPSTIPYSPGSMAYGYDMIIQTKIKVDCELIKKLKKKNIIKNNIKENAKKVKHEYKVGDEVLIVILKYERAKKRNSVNLQKVRIRLRVYIAMGQSRLEDTAILKRYTFAG